MVVLEIRSCLMLNAIKAMNRNRSNLLPKNHSKNRFRKLNDDVSIEKIRMDINILFDKLCGELTEMNIFFSDNQLDDIAFSIRNDLYSRVTQDPIALAPSFIYHLSRSFKVIFYYRIAHALFNFQIDSYKLKKLCKYYAFYISEEATKSTTIEIHPEVRIGRNFVIDHGVNTLIGATTEIGDDCTLLNNVLLGSRKITNNKLGKRHPTLCNNVHLAGGVRVLGPVCIGSNSRIGPDCVITHDIPSNSIVKQISVQNIVVKKC